MEKNHIVLSIKVIHQSSKYCSI